MVLTKIKVSYHSGKGYAKHNNHNFVKRDKGNINYNLTSMNKIWTRYDGVTDIVDAEKRLYREMFTAELEEQNNKYRKKGNYGRIRTMDEWIKMERHRPVENILQIGNMECFIDADDLWECYVKFCEWRRDKYGSNFLLISAVMHVDEATPHIHERYVWYWTDDQGVKHTGIKKSLEQAGVPLPDPAKKEGRNNYKKATFDEECRVKWQDIVEDKLQEYKDLELDRTADQARKAEKIGHMGIDGWRSYERAMGRVRKRMVRIDKEKEDLREREQELKRLRQKLEKEAEDLDATIQRKQELNARAIAKKWNAIEEREKELADQERTLKQKVDAAVKRRLDAEEKSKKIDEELEKYYGKSKEFGQD